MFMHKKKSIKMSECLGDIYVNQADVSVNVVKMMCVGVLDL